MFINKKGEHIRITRWGGVRDIDVLFEETGETRTVKSFDNIRNGKIVSMALSETKKKEAVGKKIRNRQGINMEIVRYRNAGDLDVRFEDGTIVSERAYRFFFLRRDPASRHKTRHFPWIQYKKGV